MVDKRYPNHERVPKVHAWHGCEVVHEFAAHPNTLCVVTADSVDEAVFLREETRGHTWEECKNNESEPVAERHSAADCSEDRVTRGGVVVPCDEAESGEIFVSPPNSENSSDFYLTPP